MKTGNVCAYTDDDAEAYSDLNKLGERAHAMEDVFRDGNHGCNGTNGELAAFYAGFIAGYLLACDGVTL